MTGYFRAYEAYSNEMQDYYVTMPVEKQLEGIKSTLCGRYDKRSIKLSLADLLFAVVTEKSTIA